MGIEVGAVLDQVVARPTTAAPATPPHPDLPWATARPTPHASRRAPRRTARRLVHAALWTAVIGSLVLFHDRLPDLGVIWSSVREADPRWLLVVVAAEALSMGAFARLQRRLLSAGGVSISRRRAFAVTYASNALSTTLPAGPAVSVVYSFQQFRRSGSSAQLATAVILIGGAVTSAAYTLIALLALLVDPELRWPALAALAGLLTATLALAAFVLFGRRTVWYARSAAAARRLIERQPRVLDLADQLRQGWRVLRLGRTGWGAVAALAVCNWLFDILALLAAALAVGIELAPYQVTVAYFAAQAAGSLLPLLPGGLGAIESSMVASLAAFGAAAAPAAAAVGLYRAVSYWGVVAVGWLAWLTLRDMSRTVVRLRRWAGRTAQCAGSAFMATAYCATPYAGIGPAAGPSHWTGALAPGRRARE